MQQSDRPRFASLISGMAETYQKPISKAGLAIYWQALASYDIESVERAVYAHMRNPDSGQHMPKPADLIRMIDGTTGDRAAQAWSKVHRAIVHVGPYQTLVFDDPLIHAVLTDMGGFSKLCDVTTDKMPYRAKEFETRYRGYAMRRETPKYLAKLVGEVEAHNRREGQLEHIPAPVLVGDPVKAQAVLAGGTTALPTHITTALPAPIKELAHATEGS